MELQKPGSDGGEPLLVARREGPPTPFNASDVLAAVFEQYPGPINRRHRGRLGKYAKELLEDGFDPNTVCAAIHYALRRGRPALAPDMAQDIVNARHGGHVTARQWRELVEQQTEEAREQADPSIRALRETLRSHFARQGR